MRREIPRYRYTDDPPDLGGKDPFFLLEPGPIINSGDSWLLLRSFLSHIAWAAAILYATTLWPVNTNSLITTYFPLIYVLALPAVSHWLKISPSLGYLIFGFVMFGIFNCTAFQQMQYQQMISAVPYIDRAMAQTFAFFIVVAFMPPILGSISSMTPASSLHHSAGMVLTTVAGAVMALPLHPVTRIFALLQATAVICAVTSGMIACRYGRRLAALPGVPYDSSMALRRPFALLRRLPGAGRCRFLVKFTLYLHAAVSIGAFVGWFLTRAPGPSHAEQFHFFGVLVSIGLFSAVPPMILFWCSTGYSPREYVAGACDIFVESLVVWELGNRRGIVSSPTPPFAWRPLLTRTVITVASILVVETSPEGTAGFSNALAQTPLFFDPFLLLSKAITAAIIVLYTLVVCTLPMLVYLDLIANSTIPLPLKGARNVG